MDEIPYTFISDVCHQFYTFLEVRELTQVGKRWRAAALSHIKRRKELALFLNYSDEGAWTYHFSIDKQGQYTLEEVLKQLTAHTHFSRFSINDELVAGVHPLTKDEHLMVIVEFVMKRFKWRNGMFEFRHGHQESCVSNKCLELLKKFFNCEFGYLKLVYSGDVTRDFLLKQMEGDHLQSLTLLGIWIPDVKADIMKYCLRANCLDFSDYTHSFSLEFTVDDCQAVLERARTEPRRFDIDVLAAPFSLKDVDWKYKNADGCEFEYYVDGDKEVCRWETLDTDHIIVFEMDQDRNLMLFAFAKA
ncbi:hypothetical protein QR680_002840 [Steinernema hermaphroditum]|uniref:F-box domain-containing protein n=1 Tax=Steinernema hermaphroditum TaxID=289476 RepID=A0AA39LIY9_9BILA|nr:hypothetical protein QR680_002840 [Steinernema hermaphroditum]